MPLRLDGISKSYDKRPFIEDMSLDIHEGELLCFLGPSGCGKTTLLRIVAGFEEISKGKVLHQGRDISRLPPSKRNFAMVFQGYSLFPHMTISKNIAYGLACRGHSKMDMKRRTEEMLELVNMSDMGGRFPNQLSGGQQQRVAIARALAVNPDVLLMDEPFSALDAKVRVELRSEMRRMQKKLKVTTIMVTHDQEEAMELADRIVVMNQGRIEQISTPSTLYMQPKNAFVAGFIGDMNYLRLEHTEAGSMKLAGKQLFLKINPPSNNIIFGVRPEYIELYTKEAEEMNVFDAVVSQVAFLGGFSRLVVTLADNQELELKSSENTARLLQPGSSIRIRIPENSVHFFLGEERHAHIDS